MGYNNPTEKKVVAKVEKNVHGMILKADSAFILFEVYLEEEGKKSKFYIPKNKVFGIYPNEIINWVVWKNAYFLIQYFPEAIHNSPLKEAGSVDFLLLI